MTIAIIDYGMGNLRSVQRGLERAGASVVVTDDPQSIESASKVVLPGVGAFGDAMHGLQERGLITPILRAIDAEKPFLGICLGLQLLFEVGEESGEHRGLGVVPGRAVRFQLPSEFKVPHMGWNQVQSRQVDNPIDPSIAPNSYFYFVHSYHVVPEDRSVVWLESDYGGTFCAAIRRGNLYATQFHPEKSQITGLQVLKSFVQL